MSVNITIDQALQKYLNKVGNDDLYTQKSNRICFLYNGVSLKFGDQTKVGDFFGINKTPNIIVNDVYRVCLVFLKFRFLFSYFYYHYYFILKLIY